MPAGTRLGGYGFMGEQRGGRGYEEFGGNGKGTYEGVVPGQICRMGVYESAGSS